MEAHLNKMENINAIEKNLEQIVQELKENLSGFLDDINIMRNKIYLRIKNKVCSFDDLQQTEMDMDNLITHMSVTSIMATQFHMNLRYRRTTNNIFCYGREDLIPMDKGLSYLKILDNDWQNTCQIMAANSRKTSCTQSENNFKITNDLPNIKFYDLSEFEVGQKFKAKITYIKDRQKNVFYVSKMSSKHLQELSLMTNLPKLKQIPSSEGVVFGIGICQKIYRAVRHYSPKTGNQNKSIQQFLKLIDCGEVMALEGLNSLYSIPDQYINIPSQAILCELVGVVDRKNLDQKYNFQQVLYTLEGKETYFVVKDVINSKLLVEIISNELEVQHEQPNELIKEVEKEMELTKEDEEIHHQDVTNPFSDISSTDINNNTKSDTNEEGVILDQSKETIVEDLKLNKAVLMEKPLIIFITHIAGIVEFYGQMPHENNENLTLSWRDEEIDPKDVIKDLPNVGDLLVARFNADGLWYRAQVKAINSKDSLLTVFFVDFGNEETLRLHALAAIPDKIKNQVARAKRFTLANITDATGNDRELHKRAMQTLSVLLLNQETKVQVIGIKPNDDIVINFVDEEFITMKNNLIHMNFIKSNE